METKKKKMQDYIADCPEYIRNNVAHSKELTQPIVDEYISGGYKNVWIVACGSSSNGSACGNTFVKKYLGVDCRVITPFTFITCDHDFSDTDLVVCVSQSGYSTNTIEALKLIRSKGRRTVGLTGDVNSDYKEYCDVIVNYGVGRETVGYVTRGVTTLALFFMLFAIEAANKAGKKTDEETEAAKKLLLKAADVNEQVQKDWPVFLQKHYYALSSMTNAYMCSVGANMGTAMEGALKFGETISVPTASYEAEEYIHGPNIQMTPNYTVFFIDGGVGSERLHQIYLGSRIVTEKAFLLTNNKYEDDDHVFYVEHDLPDEITPLVYLPIFQLTACMITDDLNRWIKHPLEEKMEKFVSAKSANYVNSPFSEDTPRR